MNSKITLACISAFLFTISASAQMGPTLPPDFDPNQQDSNEPLVDYINEGSIKTLEMADIWTQVKNIDLELKEKHDQIKEKKELFDDKKTEAAEQFWTIEGAFTEYEAAKGIFPSEIEQRNEQQKILEKTLVDMQGFKSFFETAQTEYTDSGQINNVIILVNEKAEGLFFEGEQIINAIDKWKNTNTQSEQVRQNIKEKYDELTIGPDNPQASIATSTDLSIQYFEIIQNHWTSDTVGQEGISILYAKADKLIATMQCELYSLSLENPTSENRYREEILFPSWRRSNGDPENICENLAEGIGITGVQGQTNDGNFIYTLFPNIVSLLFRIATPIILLSLIIAGLRMVYAGNFGSYEEDLSKSKEYLRNVVIGVLLMTLSYSIIRAAYNIIVQ